MLFNSVEFAVFLAVVFVLYHFSNHRWQNWLLLAGSYFFYGCWSVPFLSLIVISTVLDYFCGLGMERSDDPKRRRLLLTLSLLGNLGMLGVFKYYNFFAENLQALLSTVGMETNLTVLSIVLPVGISFYTFQTLSYTLDIYRGKLKPTTHFLDFALFVSFFPQLVAGPIERAKHLLPQILAPRKVTREQLSDGGWLIFWGLFKKVFIADNVAMLVDRIYGSPGEFSTIHIIIATYAFAVQIYCDFSGYSDIARGVGKLLGFDIVVNFRLPYFARNPSDFWRRWHISLSQWLRDYLYIGMGGNRGTKSRVLFNLTATMALGGLWHGADWHFVIWGLYHGALLVGYRLAFGSKGEVDSGGSRWRAGVEMFIMFHFTCISWMLFCVRKDSDIWVVVRQAFTDWSWHTTILNDIGFLLFFSLPLIVMQIFQHRTDDLDVIKRAPGWVRMLIYIAMYLCITLGGAHGGRQFIYFQF